MACKYDHRRCRWIVLLITLLTFGAMQPVFAAGEGAIGTVSISPSGGPCTPITISIELIAIGKINNSHLRLQIIEPGTNIVRALLNPAVDLPTLDGTDASTSNDSYTYVWNTDNCNFTVTSPPDYTLWICWTPGNASTVTGTPSCNITTPAPVTIQFSSVPTLEGVFLLLGGGLLGVWLWSNRQCIRAS